MSKITSNDFVAALTKKGWRIDASGNMHAPTVVAVSNAVTPPLRPQQHKKKEMTQTEVRFRDEFILPLMASGGICAWRFEAITLALDDSTSYLPDFQVTTATGAIEFYEVKGKQIWEDSVVKFKWAQKEYPEFSFFMAQFKKETGWALKRCGSKKENSLNVPAKRKKVPSFDV